jgi:acyl-CoA synthetase (AMP-forming)/AMP-acid ligase II
MTSGEYQVKAREYSSSEVPPAPVHPATLPAVIRWAASAHRDKELLVSNDRRISFAEAERQSAELARGLLALGVGKGTRIGIAMENGPDWPLCFFASSRAGAVTIALSTFYQAREFSWALKHNDIDTLLISARYLRIDYLERLERAVPGLTAQRDPDLRLVSHPFLRRIIVWGECDRPWAMKGPTALADAAYEDARIDDAYLEAIEDNIAPSDDLIVICTSGSTAEPKAVVHTHGTCVRATHEFCDYIDVRPTDRTYSGQPFFWIGGINVNLMASLYQGATLCFSPTPLAEDILDLIERERVTRLSQWPSQTHGLNAAAGGRDLSSVRTGLGPPVDAFGNIIPPERQLGGNMGMTETFGMHSIENLTMPMPLSKAGNWGRHLPGVERRVVDPDTGADVAPGAEGELYVRGYSLMRGYYKREREEIFTRDGWFATGDLVFIDEDDFLFFTGRRGDLIKTSGANVSPREVETVLQSYPEVREAIVFGVPDPIRGEKVVAVLVAQLDETINVEAILARMKADVSPYKIPVDVFVMTFEDIPRTGSQKPQKPQLKELVHSLLVKQDCGSEGAV